MLVFPLIVQYFPLTETFYQGVNIKNEKEFLGNKYKCVLRIAMHLKEFISFNT
jgi:hypothetical protein